MMQDDIGAERAARHATDPANAPPSNTERARLQTTANTAQGVDILCVMSENAQADAPGVTLKYVPDKLILSEGCFKDYVADRCGASIGSLEKLALDILSDINNEIVPRWCQIVIRAAPSISGARYTVVEDQQPNWSNPRLLSRIEPV